MVKSRAPARKPAAPAKDASAEEVHETRRLLVETAGRLCAERGFERVTGKEICKLARANPAAINYHFGGMTGLRDEVVRQAHRRMVSREALAAALAAEADPRERLRAFVGLVVASVAGASSSAWAFRVIAREIAAPSGAIERIHESEILPLQRILRSIVAGVMKLPEDHPVVARGCMTVMGPCFLLLVAERSLLQKSFPGVVPAAADVGLLSHQIAVSALAGLDAAVADLRPTAGQILAGTDSGAPVTRPAPRTPRRFRG